MRNLKTVVAFVLAALPVVACGSAPEASEATASSQEAVKAAKPAQACQSDSSCGRGQVCEPICPVIPGREHCEIVGGTCEATCSLSASALTGTTFTSLDGAHSITFTSKSKFSKTDGCPTTGIHCENIQLTTGEYYSEGTSIDLVSTSGSFDSLTVESHCYEGLVDDATGVELYPALSN